MYDDDPSYAHREIDIENNNGAIVESGDRPWQVAVQPYDLPNHRYAFAIPRHWEGSVQQFLWMPGIVSFSAYDMETEFTDGILASYALDWSGAPDGAWMPLNGIPGFADLERLPVPTKTRVYSGTEHAWYLSRYFRARITGVWPVAGNSPHATWAATDGIPPEGNERVRINAWLTQAAGFVYNREFTFVIESFTFTPAPDLAFLRPGLTISDVTSDPESPSTATTLDVSVPAGK